MTEQPDPQELVTVYTVNEPTHAEILRVALAGESIEAQISGENQGGFSGALQIDILVRACDAQRARQFILAHEEHKDD